MADVGIYLVSGEWEVVSISAIHAQGMSTIMCVHAHDWHPNTLPELAQVRNNAQPDIRSRITVSLFAGNSQ